MSQSWLDDVAQFHAKFRVPIADVPSLPDEEQCEFRLSLMREELAELGAALRRRRLPEAADGVVDLLVATLGTALVLGLPLQELWECVHRANLAKVKSPGFKPAKPANWVPPEEAIAAILQRHGWRR